MPAALPGRIRCWARRGAARSHAFPERPAETVRRSDSRSEPAPGASTRAGGLHGRRRSVRSTLSPAPMRVRCDPGQGKVVRAFGWSLGRWYRPRARRRSLPFIASRERAWSTAGRSARSRKSLGVNTLPRPLAAACAKILLEIEELGTSICQKIRYLFLTYNDTVALLQRRRMDHRILSCGGPCINLLSRLSVLQAGSCADGHRVRARS